MAIIIPSSTVPNESVFQSTASQTVSSVLRPRRRTRQKRDNPADLRSGNFAEKSDDTKKTSSSSENQTNIGRKQRKSPSPPRRDLSSWRTSNQLDLLPSKTLISSMKSHGERQGVTSSETSDKLCTNIVILAEVRHVARRRPPITNTVSFLLPELRERKDQSEQDFQISAKDRTYKKIASRTGV